MCTYVRTQIAHPGRPGTRHKLNPCVRTHIRTPTPGGQARGTSSTHVYVHTYVYVRTHIRTPTPGGQARGTSSTHVYIRTYVHTYVHMYVSTQALRPPTELCAPEREQAYIDKAIRGAQSPKVDTVEAQKAARFRFTVDPNCPAYILLVATAQRNCHHPDITAGVGQCTAIIGCGCAAAVGHSCSSLSLCLSLSHSLSLSLSLSLFPSLSHTPSEYLQIVVDMLVLVDALPHTRTHAPRTSLLLLLVVVVVVVVAFGSP